MYIECVVMLIVRLSNCRYAANVYIIPLPCTSTCMNATVNTEEISNTSIRLVLFLVFDNLTTVYVVFHIMAGLEGSVIGVVVVICVLILTFILHRH